MKVAILLGSTHIGGGTYVIFQHALHLRRCGWDVTIVTQQLVRKSDVTWHPEASDELVFKTFEEVEAVHFDIALATWFRTTYWLHRIQATSYLYFVQSIESRFFESWDKAAISFAESSYLPQLPVVTEATWIREYLAQSYGTKAELARNGIRKDIYTSEGPALEPRVPGKLRVLVEGPLGVFFKNVEKTIELCRKSSADEIWFLTSTPNIRTYPGIDRVFSCIPVEQTASIYRSCDVIVKLSYVEGMFGPPLEMFHCGGTAIVFDVTGHEEYIKNDYNALVLRKDDDEGVIQGINSLRSNPELLARLKSAAMDTAAAWPDWKTSSDEFLHALTVLSKLPCASREFLSAFSRVIGPWYDSHALLQSELKGRFLEGDQLRMILNSLSFRLMQRARRLPGASMAVRGLRRVRKVCRA